MKRGEPTRTIRVPESVWRYVRRRMRAREAMGDTVRRLVMEAKDGKRS